MNCLSRHPPSTHSTTEFQMCPSAALIRVAVLSQWKCKNHLKNVIETLFDEYSSFIHIIILEY
jgi:hypothetical protein